MFDNWNVPSILDKRQPHFANSLFYMEFFWGKISFFCHLYGIFTAYYGSDFFLYFFIANHMINDKFHNNYIYINGDEFNFKSPD